MQVRVGQLVLEVLAAEPDSEIDPDARLASAHTSPAAKRARKSAAASMVPPPAQS